MIVVPELRRLRKESHDLVSNTPPSTPQPPHKLLKTRNNILGSLGGLVFRQKLEDHLGAMLHRVPRQCLSNMRAGKIVSDPKPCPESGALVVSWVNSSSKCVKSSTFKREPSNGTQKSLSFSSSFLPAMRNVLLGLLNMLYWCVLLLLSTVSLCHSNMVHGRAYRWCCWVWDRSRPEFSETEGMAYDVAS